ncbi:MAG: hypothetical protein ISS15_05500 [Alphaproteobacteria bacterium]|nr:hypothetical protein [Alphaproteobacteria bacterium]MBL6939424.1 hypothetical protein [Alphaproteobacteria bacterium]MBL7097095.1 hypothetical protein [Alphaproteobacteria bacterium]
MRYTGFNFQSPQAFRRDSRDAARARRQTAERELARETARVAALGNGEIRKLMAAVIVEKALDGREVLRIDFTRKGIPNDRIDANLAEAAAIARKASPKVDQIGAY